MDKEEQVLAGLRNLLKKILWLNKLKMEDSLRGYKLSEIHCIEYIGKNTAPNVTKLAEAFYVTNGAISKMAKKLIKKELIESYQKPDNKKEIYFRLTEHGWSVYKIHEELHKEFQKRDKAVFEQISEEQFSNMLSFVENYNRHLDKEIKKINIDIKSK